MKKKTGLIVGLSIGGVAIASVASIFAVLAINYNEGIKQLNNNQFEEAYKSFKTAGSYKNAKDKKNVAYGLLTIQESIGIGKPTSVKNGMKSIFLGGESIDVYYKPYYEENANTEDGYYFISYDKYPASLYEDTREGCEFKSWIADDVKYIDGKSNIYLSPKWEFIEYYLSLRSSYDKDRSNMGKGQISYDGDDWYNGAGNDFKFQEEVNVYARPYSDYYLLGWYLNDTLISTDNPCTFSMPSRDSIIEAVFADID